MAGTHVIDIDQLVASLTSRIKAESGEHESSKPSIYRINQHIHNKYKDAYEPFMLSIGPYNHEIPATHAMQITKYEFLDYILNFNHGKNLSDFLEAMKEMRSKIEESMPKPHESNELIREIDKRTQKDYSQSEDDTKLQTIPGTMMHEDCSPIDQINSHDLWHDLLLLENQIPLFIITKIHELLVGGCNTSLKPLQNIIELVEIALSCYPKAISQSTRPKGFHHLLHLCHMYFIPRLAEVESNKSEAKSPMFHSLLQLGSNLFSKYTVRPFHHDLHASQQASMWHRATEYHRARIDFKKKMYYSDNPHSLLDIAYCNGMIEIPCLTIEPNTQTLFCNLIAFEQTCPQFGSYVTTYIKFLSQLIRMPNDASLLNKRGIIMHQFNSDDEVCNLFRMIGECAAFDNDSGYLKPLYDRIEADYMSRRPVLRKLLSSITKKVHHQTRKSESLGLPTTISDEET